MLVKLRFIQCSWEVLYSSQPQLKFYFSRGSSYVRQRFISCSSETHPMLIRGSFHIHQRLIPCSPETHFMFTRDSPYAQQRFIPCSPETYTCSPQIHSVFTRETHLHVNYEHQMIMKWTTNEPVVNMHQRYTSCSFQIHHSCSPQSDFVDKGYVVTIICRFFCQNF